ncbi:MAG: FAD-dependent oxidoreductase [Elusimicrobia bacterium]|nr:FAD-dependent oxidoreductase [Elusimicrobiota bacterium]
MNLNHAVQAPALGKRLLRVAVVGSGPSGFYAAEALLNAPGLAVEVDMFDRLPTPYGLVRGGVAPDHQKIKSVILVYEKVAAKTGFRFFGNIHIGKDLSTEELSLHYDQVVFAVGNETDRRLGIPGEDLTGSRSATEFVGWYNGHPDHHHHQFDLSCDKVAVVGIGNVAMDVTRILAQDPDHLAKTDIADYALDALRKSRVREVFLLGRRGPAQAAFSPTEIKEIGELHSADLVVLPEEAALDDASASLTLEPNDKKNVGYVQERARLGEGTKNKKVRLRFCVSPVEIIGERGRVAAIKIEKNTLIKDDRGNIKAKGAGRFETLPVGMVLRSVGYHGIALPGVPFDAKSGHIPNENGRVIDAQTKKIVPGAYVVGWAKRGPSGLIGTNRADSVATVQAMLEDAVRPASGNAPKKSSQAVVDLLRTKNLRFVTFEDWKALDRLEIESGARKGKIRDKFTVVDEMLSALEAAKKGPAFSA